MKISFFFSILISTISSVFAQGGFIAPQQQDSGPVGIATGQTAKLSVYYPTIPAPVSQTQAPITLVIEDDKRNILATQDFVMSGGQIVSVGVNADSIITVGNRNVQIHAYTLIPGQPAGGFPLVIPGLDIVDNATGRTVIHLETKITYPRS